MHSSVSISLPEWQNWSTKSSGDLGFCDKLQLNEFSQNQQVLRTCGWQHFKYRMAWPIGNKNSFLEGNSNNAGFEKANVLVKILKSRNLLAEMSTLDGEVTSCQWIYCCLLGLWLFSAIYLLYKCRKETSITNNSYYGWSKGIKSLKLIFVDLMPSTLLNAKRVLVQVYFRMLFLFLADFQA